MRRSAARNGPDDVIALAVRLGITVERILLEYRRIAFADARLLLDAGEDGTYRLKAIGDVDPEIFAAIHEIIPIAGGYFRVKLYDKRSALEALSRFHQMIPPPRRADEPAQLEQAEQGEDPRDTLARALARLAGEVAAADDGVAAEPGTGSDPAV